MPPAGSPPVILTIAPCFEKQGNISAVEPATYLYYIATRPSLPSQNQWVPYDAAAEDRLRSDFRSLWATNFLDDLSIEVIDYTFPNGVIGKLIKYDIEERQRIKIVDYTGSKQLESTKIDEKLKEENVTIRLDSFVDDALIRRVKGIVKGMLSEKGYLDSSVTHAITPVTGGTKTVNLTFTISEGPKYKIKKIDFVGNKAGQRRQAAQADEGHQGDVLAVLDHAEGHLQGRQVRRGRREGGRPTTATTAICASASTTRK